MTAREWLTKTIGLTVIVIIAVASFNIYIDIYGIFRDPRQRRLAGYGDDRVAKYLLSERYVPRRFNALVIGSSVSANWDGRKINGLLVYNESLNGGNIVEEKAIVDRALPSSELRVALFVVHPFLTSSHRFATVQLSPQENWGALGSQNLLDAYKDELRTYFHKGHAAFDDYGVYDLGEGHRPLNAVLRELLATKGDFIPDPVALQANRDLIRELHGANIPIVFVIPPMSQELLVSRRERFSRYADTVLGEKSEHDVIIDFTAPAFEEFRINEANFVDGVHLTTGGANMIAAEISRRLDERNISLHFQRRGGSADQGAAPQQPGWPP